MFDNIKDQALDAMKEHGDTVAEVADQAAQKAGDAADGITGGRFADKIDELQAQAGERAREFVEGQTD